MINHIQIINIADHLKTQKYILNKQRGETIIEYVKQNQLKEEHTKKEHELLILYRDLKHISIKCSLGIIGSKELYCETFNKIEELEMKLND